MPPADPWDTWSDVTGAPSPKCGQDLVWYEAGYVPGYRVCAARMGKGHDLDHVRHRWLWRNRVLVLLG